MTCPRCCKGKVVEIGMTLDARRVTMRSCSRCDTRWWERDGEVIGLPGVLELVPRRVAAG